MSTGVGSESPDSDPFDSDPTDSDPDWSGEYVARVSRSRRRRRSQIDVERDERRIARGRGEDLTIRVDDPADATARAALGAAGDRYPVAENFTEFTLGTTRLDGRKRRGPCL